MLGSIIFGIAVPTEAAAVGAIGGTLLTILYCKFTYAVLKDAMIVTLSITAIILTIVLGGLMFLGVFAGTGGPILVQEFFAQSGLGA